MSRFGPGIDFVNSDSGATLPGRPRDDVEMEVAALWGWACGKPAIGIHDQLPNGHATMARALQALADHFDLPQGWAYGSKSTTVADWADVVRRSRRIRLPSTVLLRRGDHPAPIFCLHPLSGTLFRYAWMQRHLSTPRTVYGVQSRGLHPGLKPHTDVTTMVHDYIQEVMEIYPTGPMALLGYSLGGLLAQELARQLTVVGRRPDALIIVDANTVWDPARWVRDVFTHFVRGGLQLSVDAEELLSLRPHERYSRLQEIGVTAGALPPGFDPKRLQLIVEMYYHNASAFAIHDLERWDGDLLLVRADQRSGDLGWSAFANDVAIRPLPGNHDEVMSEANVWRVAGVVEDYLTELGL